MNSIKSRFALYISYKGIFKDMAGHFGSISLPSSEF